MTLCDLSTATDARPKRGGYNGREAVVGRCPACASDGHDKSGNHLCAWADEEWLHFCRCPRGHGEEEILASLGWTVDDRRLAPKTVSSETAPMPTHDGKSWVYADEQGIPRLIKTKRVVRSSDGAWKKDFFQSTPDGTRPGSIGQGLLYNIEGVIEAVKSGATIYVNEGEKACDSFIARGYVATCQPNGAGGGNLSQKWTDTHSGFLKGAREVVIVADRDKPDGNGVVVGEAYAEYVASQLRPIVGKVSIVRSATKGDKDDAWDHFTQGFGIDQFVPMQADEQVEKPSRTGRWNFMRPSDLLAMPDKEMLVDGLIGEQDLFMLFGSPGCGKTFTALNLLVTCAVGGVFAHTFDVPKPLKVAYCSSEGQFAFKRRFAACLAQHGLTLEDVQDNMRFVSDVPQFFDHDGPSGIWGFADELEEEGFIPDILVVDTLSTAALGSKEIDNSEAALVCSVANRLAKRLKCAVGFLHHTGWAAPKKKKDDGELGEDERPRGASAYHGAMDVMISQRLDQETRAGRIRYFKGKDVEPFQPINFDLESAPEFKTAVIDFTRANPEMADADAAGAAMLVMHADPAKEWWTAAEIFEKIKGVGNKALHNALYRRSLHGPKQAFIWDGQEKPKRYALKIGSHKAESQASHSEKPVTTSSHTNESQGVTGFDK